LFSILLYLQKRKYKFKCGPSSSVTTGWTVRDRIPLGTRFSVPVQTGPGTNPASCKMDTGPFPWLESAGAWG